MDWLRWLLQPCWHPLLVIVGILACFFHLRLSQADINWMFAQVLQVTKPSSKRLLSDDEALCVEEQLLEVRKEMLQRVARVLCQTSFFSGLVLLGEFSRDPDLLSGFLLLGVVCVYICYAQIMACRINLTQEFQQRACAAMNGLCLIALIITARGGEEDYLSRFGMAIGSQILLGVVFAPSSATAMYSLGYLLVHIWCAVHALGPKALSPMFLIEQTAQALLSILLPYFVEAALRDRVEASIQSKDSQSLILAFRKMLKGICDGELLLDNNLQVCGSATCLQRLLDTQEDFVGRSIKELIVDGDHGLARFENFLQPTPESEGRTESAPQCLRVRLKASSGSIVSVDVCHVLLPRLYSNKSLHHLLSLTEDVESRKQPEAPSSALPGGAIPAPERILSPSRESSTSIASSDTCVECFDELAEMTLILNANMDLLDIEEAHLRFQRQTNKATFGMGMPTLKHFLRPLDWHPVESSLRNYARQVARGTASSKETLRSLKLRVPGQSRVHVLSRSIILSSPFERQGRYDPVHLCLQMADFRGEIRRGEPGHRLQGVEEDQDLGMQADESGEGDIADHPEFQYQ